MGGIPFDYIDFLTTAKAGKFRPAAGAETIAINVAEPDHFHTPIPYCILFAAVNFYQPGRSQKNHPP
jgi:hypothetical protein